MINQNQSAPRSIVKFSLIFPVLLLLLITFSFTEKPNTQIPNDAASAQQESALVINSIMWNGNTKYSSMHLNELLKIRKGSIYQREQVQEDIGKITSLYMDNGHMFFNIELMELIEEEKIDLDFEIYEGATAKVDKISFSGNKKISNAEMEQMININKGELFSRAKIIEAQNALAESGYFDPEQIQIMPIPNKSGVTFDLEFIVDEL